MNLINNSQPEFMAVTGWSESRIASTAPCRFRSSSRTVATESYSFIVYVLELFKIQLSITKYGVGSDTFIVFYNWKQCSDSCDSSRNIFFVLQNFQKYILHFCKQNTLTNIMSLNNVTKLIILQKAYLLSSSC